MKKYLCFIIFVLNVFVYQADALNKSYVFNDIFFISVSDILELRQDHDAYTSFLRDTLNYVAKSEIVFQQKSLSEKKPNALARYCRIMILTDSDENCPYPTPNDGDFSDSDLQLCIDASEGELGPGQHFINFPTASVEENREGNKYILVKYTRNGYNGAVSVRICYFFNYKYLVKAVFSYRLSEADLWKMPLENAINSFSWRHPYLSSTYLGNNNVEYQDSASKSYNGRLFIGIGIGICLMSIMLILYSMINTYVKKKEKTELETFIKNVNSLIEKGKIVSAKNEIESINIIHKYPEYIDKIDECKKRIAAETDDINTKIESILENLNKNIKENSVIDNTNTRVFQITSNTEIPSEFRHKLENGLKAFDEEYRKGFIPDQVEAYTQYELPICKNMEYSYYISPQIGTVLFPYRRHKIELRGYTEQNFEHSLRNAFTQFANYSIFGDVSILPADGCHPYEPDISIIEINNKYGIRIDIEIDEPYSGLEKNPIHYIGCGDEFRDRVLSNLGWIVIRFSERQIFTESSECINYIKYIISQIDHNFIDTFEYVFPTSDKRWTEIEAKKMAAQDFREKLLNHQFGKKEIDTSINNLFQTDFEKLVAKQVTPIIIRSGQSSYFDKTSNQFLQDDKLTFDPYEHIYLYDGKRQLKAVSNIVDSFFEPFDSLGLSERVAIREGRNQCEVLEDWDSKGLESRQIGTFLHSQIEAFFKHDKNSNSIDFVYNGEYIHINKKVSIQPELDYFKTFLNNNIITPYKVEWHICDVELGIAGTIDLLSKNGSKFEIYDWKRSRKASPDETVWRYGTNGLSHIPDISFYHYALQLNLYKYILEKNYGLTVDNMYIVVLHSMYDNYKIFQIPNMKKDVNIIINHLMSNPKN